MMNEKIYVKKSAVEDNSHLEMVNKNNDLGGVHENDSCT